MSTSARYHEHNHVESRCLFQTAPETSEKSVTADPDLQMSRPAQPADEPTQPADEPAQPADEPAQPADEPAQPADEHPGSLSLTRISLTQTLTAVHASRKDASVLQ